MSFGFFRGSSAAAPMPVATPVAVTMSPAPLQQATYTQSPLFVYVDPIYGDDGQAMVLNPINPAVNSPANHQGALFDPHTDTGQVAGFLQHAPYSFKTVTAALSYVQQFNPNGPLYSNSSTQVQLNAIVIHCLPGLYGPVDEAAGLALFDPDSGLPFNDESFPLSIPDHVSIQGTSALDTIFDARGTETHIFEFMPNPVKAPIAQTSHVLSFIDGVTIRNAGGSTAPQGAGIYVSCRDALDEYWVDIRPKFSNCFITGNVVGIAVHGGLDHIEETSPSGPIIFNNTIAWNTIGVWNGQLMATPSYGWAQLCVFNNIFDATPYTIPATTSGSAFEGMHGDDMLARQTTPTGTTYVCFNAWEYYSPSLSGWGKANTAGGAGGWPSTWPRQAPAPTPLTPRLHGVISIDGITGAGQTPQPLRGILYVSDLLEARVGHPVSPHDFRLSPMVSANRQALTSLSPVVDQGTFSIPSGSFKNGLQTTELGLANPLAGTAGTYLGTDVDCEGFGNPRSAQHAGYTLLPVARPDLGADELDNLLIAGFLPSTRILSRDDPTLPPAHPSIADHTEILFVNLPQATYPRPIYNISLSEGDSVVDLNWFSQLVTNPNPPQFVPASNYTNGVVAHRTQFDALYGFTPPPNPLEKRPNFMRNLRCDFSPHPLMDLHPLWPEWFKLRFNPKPLGTDPVGYYATNPWVRDTNYRVSISSLEDPHPDNEFLYYDPNVGPDNISGHLNPPGTFHNNPAVWGNYLLWEGWPTGQLGPWNGGGSPSYATDQWGVGDATALNTIDRVPEDQSWRGVRYNAQVFFGTQGNPAVPYMSNLQTFLGVNGEQILPPALRGGTETLSAASAKDYIRPVGKQPEGDLTDLVRKAPWWRGGGK
jgi:hypothetical protein